MYIDDAMNDGAFVPEPKPKRCRVHSQRRQQQLALDGGTDLVCVRCGAVTEEDITGVRKNVAQRNQ